MVVLLHLENARMQDGGKRKRGLEADSDALLAHLSVLRACVANASRCCHLFMGSVSPAGAGACRDAHQQLQQQGEFFCADATAAVLAGGDEYSMDVELDEALRNSGNQLMRASLHMYNALEEGLDYHAVDSSSAACLAELDAAVREVDDLCCAVFSCPAKVASCSSVQGIKEPVSLLQGTLQVLREEILLGRHGSSDPAVEHRLREDPLLAREGRARCRF